MAMQYDVFLKRVQERAGLASRDEARRVAEATLATLAERLTEAEADDLAAQLPPDLKPHLLYQGARGAVDLSLDEFYAQVGAREGATTHRGIIDRAGAARHGRAPPGTRGRSWPSCKRPSARARWTISAPS